MLDTNRLEKTTSELIHTISRLTARIGIIQKIDMNFEGLAIVSFTKDEGVTSPLKICETLERSKGAIGALECLDSVTVQMTMEIDEIPAQVGVEIPFPPVDSPTLLYVDAPQLGFSIASHRVLFMLYEALHMPRALIPPPTEKPGSDAVHLLECLLQKARTLKDAEMNIKD